MKISVVGAGNVGASAAVYLLEEKLADELVVVDIIEGLPQGKCLDLAEVSPIRGYPIKIAGANDYAKIEGSDIIVVTAGVARKPGMSRLDLLKINEKIIKSVATEIKAHAPNAIVIVVSNPLDVMCYVTYKVTGFPKNRVFGMAGVLDTSRFRYFVAEKANVDPTQVQAMVLGGHGDEMVPVISSATISGVPLTKFLSKEDIDAIIKRTQGGGAEIVALLKTGSAFYAPAASIAEMVKSVVKDTKKILPVTCYLDGEFGAKSVYCGVPARLGRNGIEQIIEIALSADEKAALNKSISVVQESIKSLEV